MPATWLHGVEGEWSSGKGGVMSSCRSALGADQLWDRASIDVWVMALKLIGTRRGLAFSAIGNARAVPGDNGGRGP